MDQNERRLYLIKALTAEQEQYADIEIPEDEDGQRQLLRALMNVRVAAPVTPEFERVQDEYLRQVNAERGIVTLDMLEPVLPDIYLWQGDITRLACGAIVNAANSGMTGCYRPNHNCIDNCIHTYAGVQLRNYCSELMQKQGYEEPTGQAKITPAFNLPCRWVIHTVGPVVQWKLHREHESLLESCYRSCLALADEYGAGSIAFCCISTGVFMFPNQRAAEIAVEAVSSYKARTGSGIKVVFNVFKDEDLAIYRSLLAQQI